MASEEWYRKVHERLLARDPVASMELAEAAWEPLVEELEKRHPRLRNSDFLRDSASDALINYIKQPSQFDPQKRGLFGFLIMAAEGDLRNALAKATRRKRVEIPVEDVELPTAGGKRESEPASLGAQLDAQRIRGRIEAIFKDPRDREAVELIVDGERSTKIFAKVWGLGGLPAKEQASEVKRHKDRVKKMFQRHGERGHGWKR